MTPQAPLLPRPATPAPLPMIFLVALLLMIAMLVTPAIGGPYLPAARTAMPVGANPLSAGIDERGAFFLRESTGWKPIADAELSSRLGALVRSRPGETRLYVEADRSVPYTRLMMLADAARASGIRGLDLGASCPAGRETLFTRCAP